MLLTIVHPKSYQDIQIPLPRLGEVLLNNYSDRLSATTPVTVETIHGTPPNVSLRFEGDNGSLSYTMSPSYNCLDKICIKEDRGEEVIYTTKGIQRAFENAQNVAEHLELTFIDETLDPNHPPAVFLYNLRDKMYTPLKKATIQEDRYPIGVEELLRSETPLQTESMGHLIDHILDIHFLHSPLLDLLRG